MQLSACYKALSRVLPRLTFLNAKTRLIMKLTIVLMIIGYLHVHANGSAQTITLSMRNASLESVLKQIKKQSGLHLVYREEWMNIAGKVSVNLKDASIRQALDACFKDQPLTYELVERTIVIKKAGITPVAPSPLQPGEIQDIVVSGKVIDETGAPLANVSVVVKDLRTGSSTDINGEFRISVPDQSAILVFSYVGFKQKEVNVGKQSTINVTLLMNTQGLGEVVVIGYGTQSKAKITSSISEISTAKLKDLPITTSGQLLEGRVSGVAVKQANGAPGTAPSIMVHGVSSINAGIGPLIVIDGFPIGTQIPLSLNPSDIEKITVLKDAASTSIYGARGSNGVILIQTTKAKESRAEIEYNGSAGLQYVPEFWLPEMLNAVQYAEYNKQVVDETNALNNTSRAVPQIFLDVLANPEQYGEGYNWQDFFLRQGTDAPFQNHNLTLRAGTKQVKGVISGGYLSQKGVLPNSDFKRYSLRSSVEGNFTSWLKASANVSMARTETNAIPDRGPRGLLMAAITASPLKSPYDENGELIPYVAADAPGYFAFPNPLYQAAAVKDNTVGRDVNGGLNLDFEIIKGLHFKPQGYVRMYTEGNNSFVPTTIGVFAIGSIANLSPGAPPYVNSATNQNFDITNWGIDNLLTYDKTFGAHTIGILAGYTAQKQTGELSQINATNFPADGNLNFLEASQVVASVSDYTNWSLDAFFARVNYDYQGRYLLDLNFRREGSSKFGANNKYGNFPSGSIGWRISQEDFYPKDFFMNELKVRASYGKTGNNAIGDFDQFGNVLSIPNLSNINNNYNYVLNNGIITGRALTSIGSENLKWETASQMDIGVTLGFLNNRLTVKADYYKKTTEDMLFNVTLPAASGFSSSRVNIGEMVNTGWDFEAGYNLNSKNFTWNSNLNLSLLKNEVTSMPSQITKIIAGFNITEVGRPVGSLYGYQIDGIFNAQEQLSDPKLVGWPGAKALGAYVYRDMTGDGKIDAADQTEIGNPHPKTVFGFNNVFTYRNFSLSVLATGAFGYQILPEINEVLYNEKQRWNVSTRFLNRWRSPEDPGDGLIPAVFYAGQHSASNIWVENGDHVWIKNITLGYSIPEKWIQRTKVISSLRFYVSLQNVAKFTNYTGWNPEVSYYGGDNPATFGVDNFSYPLSRTYTFGVSISL